MKEAKEKFKAKLMQAAIEFWETECGLRFGQVQTLNEIGDIPGQYGHTSAKFGYLPDSIKFDTKFLVERTSFDSDGNTTEARISLWVRPITKSGEPSKREIRLFAFWLY